MDVKQFEFDLPSHLIAQYPTPGRTDSRLMHVNAATGELTHYHFRDLPQLLSPADLMVFNNTRVVPARMYGAKATGGRVELLLERVLDEHTALVQIRASKSPKPGTALVLDPPVAGEFSNREIRLQVLDRQAGFYQLRFPAPGVLAIAHACGHMPLPPYIDRADEAADESRYQTVYGTRDGAVAAPTAGLHFDEQLLATLDAQGVTRAEVTLHVGAGTFQPVRVEKVEEHDMHSEQLEVSAGVCDAVSACRERAGRVVAVGTTSVRCLETASASGSLVPFQGDTNIFIYPGYEFRAVDALITNFHLSGSTLMMLVSAFTSLELMQHAYQTAIKEQYRFFSYGDAMLITR